MIEIGVGAWLLCGIAAAVIAKARGAGGCLWFIVGFFLGPIGLIIAIFAAQPPGRCPNCRKPIDPVATRCPYCRSVLNTDVLPGGSYCDRCGTAVPADAKFCQQCGARMN